jgi:hypothetical protein
MALTGTGAKLPESPANSNSAITDADAASRFGNDIMAVTKRGFGLTGNILFPRYETE